jgi:hypothetical protein
MTWVLRVPAIGIVLMIAVSVIAQPATEWVRMMPNVERGQQVAVSVESAQAATVKLRAQSPGFLSEQREVAGTTYRRLMMPGAGISVEAGKPELPVIRRLIQIPLGASASVRNVRSDHQDLNNYTVFPSQGSMVEWYKADPVDFIKDSGVYTRNRFYPDNIVMLGTPAILRGVQVVPVEIHPVQYNPVTRSLRIHSNITFDVTHAGAAATDSVERAEAAYTENIAPLLQRHILNYQVPSLSKINKWKTWPWFVKLDYLIITHDDFFDAIQPLADSKRDKGLTVEVVKLSQISSSGPSADEIAAFIKKRYLRSFPRLSWVHYRHNHPSVYENSKKVGTDLYYATMDGEGDFLPDIAIGRLPGDSPEQIKAMVEKIVQYQRWYQARTLCPHPGWFNCVLLCGYFQDGNNDGVADRWFLQTSEEIHEYLRSVGYKCQTVYTATAGSPANKKYNDGVTPVPSTVLFDGSTQAVINGIDHGVFLATHRDHGDSRNGPYGSIDGWADPHFVAGDVGSLQNTGEYPVFFSINCRSGWFDGETDQDGGSTKTDCLGEALLKATRSGASGFVGSTRISYSGYNDALAKGMIDALWADFDQTYTDLGSNHLGDVLNFAKVYMAEQYGYPDESSSLTTLIEFEEFNLLGDPEMPVRPEWQLYVLQRYPKVFRQASLPIRPNEP